VRALRDDTPKVTPWEDPSTIAPGLLVPAPFASERILEAIRESHGDGVTVNDRELVDAMVELARHEGVSASPEGAAPFAAVGVLARERRIQPGETVLLYNTGSGIPFSVAQLRESLDPPPKSP
jgi:threonine synthase